MAIVELLVVTYPWDAVQWLQLSELIDHDDVISGFISNQEYDQKPLQEWKISSPAPKSLHLKLWYFDDNNGQTLLGQSKFKALKANDVAFNFDGL